MLKRDLDSADLLKRWQMAKDSAAHYKAEESVLRQEIIMKCSMLQHDPFAEGTEHVIMAGLGLKIGHAVNYELVGEEKEIRNTQHRIGKMIGLGLSERLVAWKPRLILSEYRKLPVKATVLIERHVERKTKTKSLELI